MPWGALENIQHYQKKNKAMKGYLHGQFNYAQQMWCFHIFLQNQEIVMSQKIFMSVFLGVTQYEFENFNNSYTEV